MELFEINIRGKYQDTIDNNEAFTPETVTEEHIRPLGFSGDIEMFQETLAEITGEVGATVNAAHLQEAVEQSREECPEMWRGNWAVLVDSHHGIYCPQIAAQSLAQARTEGVSREDLAALIEGPEHKDYWEIWEDVLNNCVILDEGERFTIVQDGDVFIVPEEI